MPRRPRAGGGDNRRPSPHYPKEEAARIALNAIGEEMAHGYEGEVIVCCFSEEDAEVYRELLSC